MQDVLTEARADSASRSGFLDLAGAIEYTRLSRSTLLLAIKARRLRAFKPCGRLLFDPADLDQYVMSRPVWGATG